KVFGDEPIVVTIEDAQTFWIAEDYHQDFYKKNVDRYEAEHAPRQDFIDAHWGVNEG
ncbi:peptide-methionine (S)-S-oxide reductase, partial [Weissella soli]